MSETPHECAYDTPGAGMCPTCVAACTPAEPDAGDAEAHMCPGAAYCNVCAGSDSGATEVIDLNNLCNAFDRKRYDTHDWCMTHGVAVQPDAVCPVTAAALDAVRRKAGDERAEQIAQAMSEAFADRVTWGDGTEYIAVTEAQRIAREPRA